MRPLLASTAQRFRKAGFSSSISRPSQLTHPAAFSGASSSRAAVTSPPRVSCVFETSRLSLVARFSSSATLSSPSKKSLDNMADAAPASAGAGAAAPGGDNGKAKADERAARKAAATADKVAAEAAKPKKAAIQRVEYVNTTPDGEKKGESAAQGRCPSKGWRR